MRKRVINQGDDAKSVQTEDVRARILRTASELFYKHGVRAVGVDMVIEVAGVAKTSLYRHFRNKDELIAEFLRSEDEAFWNMWNGVADLHADDPLGELDAHAKWIGQRVARSNYRGCPQINVAAEFPEEGHPARKVALAHKKELRRRFKELAQRLQVKRPDELAGQLSLVVNGAFVSSQVLWPEEAATLLGRTIRAVVAAAAP